MDPGTVNRRGVSSIYVVVMLVALCGLVSFGVDMGRVQLAKTQLQSAADAAVRAAAGKIDDGVTAAKEAAVAIAAANACDGDPVVLDPAQDVELGRWDKDARTFTPLSGASQSSANAIRVTARRIAARDTAIPLVFAQVVGKSSFDIEATAIAIGGKGSAGFVGLSRMSLMNNTEVGSYRSADGVPGPGNLWPDASLGSNGELELKNNGVIGGDILLGPGGTLDVGTGTTFTGTLDNLSGEMAYPAVDASAVIANNDNAQIGLTSKGRSPLSGTDFSISSEDITIPGGTYYFTSFNVHNGTVSFSGPTTIYIDGDADLTSTAIVQTYQNIPANLRIRLVGSRTFALGNTVQLFAEVYGPQSTMTLGNGAMLAGAAIVDVIDAPNNAMLYFDESLMGNNSGDGYGFEGNPIAIVR
jgi:hypothetical protein